MMPLRTLLFPTLVALAGAASCAYYTELPSAGGADGGSPDAATSSSGAGGSSSSGFVTPPPFAPTFDNDAGPGVLVYAASCPTPQGTGLVADGTYTYISGCMEDARFPAQFPFCREGAVVKRSLAKIQGSITVSSGGAVAQRVGTLLYAVDIDLPCRRVQGNGSCATIQGQVSAGLAGSGTPAKVACYDVSEEVCNCQVEATIDLGFGEFPVETGAFYRERVPFWVDPTGGLTVTRATENLQVRPEANGYWRLTK